MEYAVWVGGSEINSHLLSKEQALEIAQEWKEKGYDDVSVVGYDKEAIRKAIKGE